MTINQDAHLVYISWIFLDMCICACQLVSTNHHSRCISWWIVVWHLAPILFPKIDSTEPARKSFRVWYWTPRSFMAKYLLASKTRSFEIRIDYCLKSLADHCFPSWKSTIRTEMSTLAALALQIPNTFVCCTKWGFPYMEVPKIDGLIRQNLVKIRMIWGLPPF